MVVLAISMMTILAQQPQESDDIPSESPAPARITYEAHNPICINGNEGFLGPNASTGISWGNGTELDPYIIEGWFIYATTFYRDDGIAIYNTTAHFIVRACMVVCPMWYIMEYVPSGIILHNCTNGSLDSNNCSEYLLYGICLEESSNITISNSTFRCDCGMIGDVYDIWLDRSDNITISNSTCSSYTPREGRYGMHIRDSSNCIIEDNNCNSLERYGIWLGGGSNHVVTRNILYGNILYGVASSSHNSRIWNNTFNYNNGAGNTFDPLHIQACDDGTNNWWNSTDGYGNYWSDWTIPDDSPPDGIVDVPYDIAGTAGAKDYYPRTTTPTEPIPEFGVTGVVVIIIAMVCIFVAVRRATLSSTKE